VINLRSITAEPARYQQPQPATLKPTAEQLAKAKRRAEQRSDLLYVGGGVLVTAGVAMIRLKFALMTAGAFCLVFPVLELTAGFIRGLRVPQRR
jgi:hypothetical protein